MRRGDFEAAWHISDEFVQKRTGCARAHGDRESTWCGEPLEGKRVLVRCCYGLGDTFQFIRYVPLLRGIARHLRVQTQADIAEVLQHVNGIDALTTRYNTIAPETYDVAVGLTELPHVFRTTLQTIPAAIPYINNIAPRFFPPTTDLRVGVVWEGSDWDQRRIVPVQLFAQLERIPGVTLHILQRGRALIQRSLDFGTDSGSDDVYEAAQTIASLDLMITIDSMPAHLAGAMGVRTWVLLHSDPDWRWMQNRADSPWYPTMRLFRQKIAGDWEHVFVKVKQELERVANEGLQKFPVAV